MKAGPTTRTLTLNMPSRTRSITRTTWVVRRGCRARVWYIQFRLEEARSEALDAADIFKKLGAVKDLVRCEGLLRWIEEEIKDPVAPFPDGELLGSALPPTSINSPRPLGVRKALDSTVPHVYPGISFVIGVYFGEWRFVAASVSSARESGLSSQGSVR